MEYKIVNNHGHWEGYINGEFYCSGDTFNEVVDDVLKEVYEEDGEK